MSYVPGYDHDVFVSYAKVDNDPVPSAKSGWVDTLISILVSGNGLAGKLGRRELFEYCGAPERLFIIYKEQLVEPRHKMPEAFIRPRKYKFWDLDKNNKPRVLGWPQPIYNNPEDRPYFQAIDDLCSELATKLEHPVLLKNVSSSSWQNLDAA